MAISKNEDSYAALSNGRIFLVGFMGTGKTHWGRMWAARHRYHFIDLDDAIEQDEQLTITDIFEKKGEDYFRQKEAIMLRSMTQYPNAIIACGGGTPCFFDNINWMNDNGATLLLEATPAVIFKNVMLHEGKRPLVKNLNEAELIFYIEQKLAERKPYYDLAEIKFKTEEVTERTLDKIIHPTE